MKPLSIMDVRNAVAGKAVTVIPQDFPPIVEICTDTRRMAKSSLFVALKGEKYDGAQFLAQAAAGDRADRVGRAGRGRGAAGGQGARELPDHRGREAALR
jgi:UDP-N-acetylmuramyl tripeptide synthase